MCCVFTIAPETECVGVFSDSSPLLRGQLRDVLSASADLSVNGRHRLRHAQHNTFSDNTVETEAAHTVHYHPLVGTYEKSCHFRLCVVEGEELYGTAADLARFAVGPAGVPVGGLPTCQAVQGVAGGGFKQSLVGTLLLGARGQAGDQLAHLLQVTWDQHQKTILQAGTGQDKSVQFASAERGSTFQSANSPWHSHYSIIHE